LRIFSCHFQKFNAIKLYPKQHFITIALRKVFNKLLAHTMQSALKGNETDVFNIKATIAAQTKKGVL